MQILTCWLVQSEGARKLKSAQELHAHLDKTMFDSDMLSGWVGLKLAVFTDV